MGVNSFKLCCLIHFIFKPKYMRHRRFKGLDIYIQHVVSDTHAPDIRLLYVFITDFIMVNETVN